ncbi:MULTISPECIES: asparagine synthase-related protein [unclassified Marinomonas]
MDYKFRNNETKWCLKEVLYQYMPKKLLERSNMRFGILIGAWLR